MGWGDLEKLAVEQYRRHHLDPSEPTPTLKLAKLELGERGVYWAPRLRGGPAMTFVLHGERKIAIKKKLPPELARFLLGHELAHVILEREGYVGVGMDDLEDACDLLGAALMAPQPAVASFVRQRGLDLAGAAKAVGATQTWAGLRFGEALDWPVAVIAPKRLRVRGLWTCPLETIRVLAKGSSPTVRKVAITDSRGRTCLFGKRAA